MPRKNTSSAEYPQAVLHQIERLAQHIVVARKRRKETQAQWAQRLGVSQPTMARIERGDPSVAMASYVMCMWLINQAQGLADLIAPQNDMASLEREVARTQPRAPAAAKPRAAQGSPAEKDRYAPASVAQADSAIPPPGPAWGAAHSPAQHHVAEAEAPGFKPRSRAPVPSTAEPSPGAAAGLAALIAGDKKARP